ncbi:MAG: GH3 auxin-responsive promoter family protein [Flavobacteriales bacterium]
MSLKASLSKAYAKRVVRKIKRDASRAVELQQGVLLSLTEQATATQFGLEHKLAQVTSHDQFVQATPIRDYEDFIPYIDRIKHGERSVLWPGQPLYFCKTSGTTSGTKYIPLTRQSLPNHINSARNALLSYIAETGRAEFVTGKMIFLQGSPKLEKLESGIKYGRLSGIVANHVPKYLQKNRMPSYATNCIEDWETKVNAIADETMTQNMSLISGIPSWVQMYFEILLRKTGNQTIREIFPDFNLFVYGGVNFEPYRKNFESLIGRSIPTIELYPASEGFIAYQDSQTEEGLLLNVNSGIYFEFIVADEYHSENPKRIALADVKVGVNYALILSSNAGLWAYSIGDTVKFVSLNPPRIKVTGRIKHYTSAFGEHVIGEEADKAMGDACAELNITVTEFHLAPQTNPADGLPYHEWLVETDTTNVDVNMLAKLIDESMQQQNIYYRDLIKGYVLKPAVVTLLPRGAFNTYMKSVGKLGGQNKVPRLANDRKIADQLSNLKI